MTDELDLTSMVNNASFRRLWLLRKAMESAPLDRAVDLARMAEEFIAGSRAPAPFPSPSVVDTAKTPPPPTKAAITEPSREPLSSEPRPGLGLSAEQRGRLLDHLATGARNAELATEFGLSPRQVQGIRMGSAREIAERRNALANGTPLASDHSQEQRTTNGTYSGSDHSHGQPGPKGTAAGSDYAHQQAMPNGTASGSDSSREEATADDIVRYLRQQDDIVVPQGDGAFLVNGRFRLDLAELVARANKMRARHGKFEFRLARELSNQGRVRQATRHPVFWEQDSGSDQVLARAN